jgi:hypothetical protein
MRLSKEIRIQIRSQIEYEGTIINTGTGELEDVNYLVVRVIFYHSIITDDIISI